VIVAVPTVIYDANVLYPAPLRDLLIPVAMAGLVRARWTDAIHEEWIRNLLLKRTRQLMDRAVPDCLVIGYEGPDRKAHAPDPDDRHVLAAAIHAKATLILNAQRARLPEARARAARRYGASPRRVRGGSLRGRSRRSLPGRAGAARRPELARAGGGGVLETLQAVAEFQRGWVPASAQAPKGIVKGGRCESVSDLTSQFGERTAVAPLERPTELVETGSAGLSRNLRRRP
jgi:hypothetical protein